MAARRRIDRYYDMACTWLRDQSPIMPDDAVIEAKAAEFRREDAERERADREAAAGSYDLKDIELSVKRKVRAGVRKLYAGQPKGLPRPSEVLRNADRLHP